MSGATFLTGDLVTLKTVEAEDLEFLRDGVNHPAVRRPVGQSLPTNGARERRYFDEMSESDELVQLLITSGDERVGVIELDAIDYENGTAEVAYWIDPEQRRQGYARDAVLTTVGYAFDELRLHKVTASVYEFNVASLELLKDVGFTEEGVHRDDAFVEGRYVDTHWFGVLDSEWRD